MLEGKVVGADNEAELELFKSVNFTNALVLKINQLAKQVKLTTVKLGNKELFGCPKIVP
jgi:hypothetical protein